MCKWCGCGCGPFKVRVIPPGFLKPYVLKLLLDKPMHGYGIMEAIYEKTGHVWRPGPGAIYPALSWLKEKGFIEAIETPEPQTGKLRKSYSITDVGRAALDEYRLKKDEWLKGLKWLRDEWGKL